MKIVVIGAGIGGQIISKCLSNKYPNDEVVLVGKLSNESFGLFYLNEPIEGVTDKKFKVEYYKLGDGSIEDYQVKSRGFSSKEIKTSSFNKVGKSEDGYLLRKDFLKSLETINISENATFIDLKDKVITLSNGVSIEYDYLISTIPLGIFMKLIGDNKEFKFEYTKVYENITPPISSSNYEDNVDLIKVFYDTTDSIFYRHSSYYVGDNLMKMISETISEDSKLSICHPYGKIVPNKEFSDYVSNLETKYDYLKLCGRYARWDYHYMISDSYHDAMKFISEKTT